MKKMQTKKKLSTCEMTRLKRWCASWISGMHLIYVHFKCYSRAAAALIICAIYGALWHLYIMRVDLRSADNCKRYVPCASSSSTSSSNTAHTCGLKRINYYIIEEFMIFLCCDVSVAFFYIPAAKRKWWVFCVCGCYYWRLIWCVCRILP